MIITIWLLLPVWNEVRSLEQLLMSKCLYRTKPTTAIGANWPPWFPASKKDKAPWLPAPFWGPPLWGVSPVPSGLELWWLGGLELCEGPFLVGKALSLRGGWYLSTRKDLEGPSPLRKGEAPTPAGSPSWHTMACHLLSCTEIIIRGSANREKESCPPTPPHSPSQDSCHTRWGDRWVIRAALVF